MHEGGLCEGPSSLRYTNHVSYINDGGWQTRRTASHGDETKPESRVTGVFGAIGER